uniref:Large ribosomal subunit protein mL38 n=1 Tax=Panagrellus redivivus TaxID=6233 RepID=A0A7E4V3R5_PANRE
MRRVRSIYAEHYIKRSHRAKFTPRVNRPWRPRVIAWAGPGAFMRDRWYERDGWYKARIQKPEVVPRLHIIDPDRIVDTFEEATRVVKPKEINIGFKRTSKTPTIARDEAALEIAAHKRTLEVDLSQLSFDQLSIYDHFNIFEDLFVPGVYFNTTQKVAVRYGSESVARGNLISSTSIAKEAPEVEIEALGTDAYNTLLMVNLDGDAYTPEAENEFDKTQILHWFVGNIPDGAKVDSGETVVPYLPPTPYKGTGYHRVAFLLLRHKEKIDFSSNKITSLSLADRIFRVNRFAKQHESTLTPTAVSFAQFRWDESVDETLHAIGSKSPRFFYEWNEPLKPEQKEYPAKPMPFNLYLDMYRPPEVVQREMFSKKLERLVHDGKCEPAPYPDMFYAENRKKLPNWQHKELIKENTGAGKYASLYLKSGFVNAVEQASDEKKKETAV